MNASELLRRAASDFWWMPEHVIVSENESITIAASPGNELLFNQAVPHRVVGQETVDAVVHAHAGCSRWWVTDVSESDHTIEALHAAGYVHADDCHGYVIETDSYPTVSSEFDIRRVTTMDEMTSMYTSRQAIFGGLLPTSEQLALEFEQCHLATAKVARYCVWDADVVAATGSLTFMDDLGIAFIWAGGVREEYRGRGLYKQLLAARAKACRDRGITWMGLYAKTKTSAPIVKAHGFSRAGFLTYYERR